MDAIDDPFEAEMKNDDEITELMILNNLIHATDQDVDLKTQIDNPKKMSSLYLWGQYLRDIGYPDIKKDIRKFSIKFMRNMYSFKRGSRQEVVQGVVGLKSDERYKDTLDKLIERSG